MRRSNMKADTMLTVRSNCKPEGRIFPRRKVASKSHLLNGGISAFDMDMSLAIQESLKYAQQNNSEECVMNSVLDEDNNNRGSVDSNDNDIRRVESNPALASSDYASLEEVGRMKDLLLAQANLIHCKQEEIARKDKEIKFLRDENDNLQCRLTRMERRLSILRQKGQDSCLHATEESGSNSKDSDDESQSACANSKRKNTFHKPGLKKRYRGSRLTHVKKNGRWRTVRKDSSSLPNATESEEGAESDYAEEKSSKEEESASEAAASDDESEGLGHNNPSTHSDDNEEESKKRVYIDYPVMQTEMMYHMYYPKSFCPGPDVKKIQERAAQQLEVETPSWRMNPLTNMYQLEGTENITDEAYFKRHQKYELEEKRRKRWDLQRSRELKMFEKFEEEKECALRESQDEADMETFLPSLQDLTHIEVSDTVPVMVFGQPVPSLTPEEFAIPWEINCSQPTSSRFKPNDGKGSRRH